MPAFPPKTNYAAGDVLTAAQMNDVGNALSAYQFTAGKNKIINGDFRVNQRNFTSNTVTGSYNFDRWYQANGGTTGTLTITPQTFTPGTAPVAGYEGNTFIQCVTASGASANTFAAFVQRIEDVRTFAGQTATLSFWAKAATGTPKIALEIEQNFGSGGSPSSLVRTYINQVTISDSWARYSIIVSVPSISGKTLGTTANTSFLGLNLWLSAGSDSNSRTGSMGLQNNTFQVWGVQLEAGSTATPFTTASGSIGGELALCQRYYWRNTATDVYSRFGATGAFASATTAYLVAQMPVTMRTTPNVTEFANLAVFDYGQDIAVTNCTASNQWKTTTALLLQITVAAGGTQFRPCHLDADNNAAAYIAFSAEL